MNLDHVALWGTARHLEAFDMRLVGELGWAELQNGALLRAAGADGFDVLLTGDQRIKFQQSMAGWNIGVVAMSDNHWNIVREHLAVIFEALDRCEPGMIMRAFCGKFVQAPV